MSNLAIRTYRAMFVISFSIIGLSVDKVIPFLTVGLWLFLATWTAQYVIHAKLNPFYVFFMDENIKRWSKPIAAAIFLFFISVILGALFG